LWEHTAGHLKAASNACMGNACLQSIVSAQMAENSADFSAGANAQHM